MVGTTADTLGRIIAGIGNQVATINNNISPDETNALLNLFNSERLSASGQLTLVSKTYSSDSFILDHAVYGELDSSILKLDGGYYSGLPLGRFYDDITSTLFNNYYKLEGNANDATGISNGTLRGSPTLVSNGMNGSCYSFNSASSQYFDTNLDMQNLPTSTSISLWFKPATMGSYYLISLYKSGDADRAGVSMSSTGVISYGWYLNDSTYINSSSLVSTSQWNNVIVTYADNSVKLYVNGLYQGVVTSAGRSWNNGTENVMFGAINTSPMVGFFNGLMDEMAIFNVVLSEAQVSSIYNAALTSSTIYNVKF